MILGPVEAVTDDGDPISLGGPRVRALLAFLALEPGRVVPVDRLVDGLWGQDLPGNAANALQTLVKRLRTAVGQTRVVARATGYLLDAAIDGEVDAAADQVDAATFLRLADEGSALLAASPPSPDLAAKSLDEALALWRGPALADVAMMPFAEQAITQLTERRLDAVMDRAQAYLDLGRPTRVIEELTTELAADPLRERLAVLLMRALRADGRRSEALAVFERTRRELADQLGVGPSASLAQAHLESLDDDPPPPRVVAVTNLQARLTSFVGRQAEVDGLTRRLAESRLVTVVGAGGAGKTRLAGETALHSLQRWPGGVWQVELAPVGDPSGVPFAFLKVFAIRDTDGPDAADRLAEVLSREPTLLVVDNCEHVIDAAARLVEDLLVRCPHLRVLATSREPLGIEGEALCPVPPLASAPRDAGAAQALQYASVRLFADRAASVRPGFAVDDDNVAAVVAICSRLDGAPLAIELAAARSRALTPQKIAERLDDRFRLLTGGSRTALPRHQTLRAVVDWSWGLLSERERRLLCRLSVFSGGASLDAAEAMFGDEVLDVLPALVDKSLLEVDRADRYRMLETIRAFALERLAEAGETQSAAAEHARYFLDVAEGAVPQLFMNAQLEAIELLGAEHDNMVTALRWAIDHGEVETALRLCGALIWFWWLRGHRLEAYQWARQAVASAAGGVPQGAARAYAASVFATHIAYFVHPTDFSAVTAEPDRLAGTAQEFDHLLALARAEGPVPPMLEVSGAMLTAMAGDQDAALRWLDRCAEAPDPWLAAAGRMMRGNLRIMLARPDLAGPDLQAAVTGFRALGERWGLSQALLLRFRHAAITQGIAAASPLIAEAGQLIADWLSPEEAVATLMRLAHERLIAEDVDGAILDTARAKEIAAGGVPPEWHAQIQLAEADIARRQGDFAAAWPAYAEGLEAMERGRLTVPQDIAWARAGYGRALTASGDPAAGIVQHRLAVTALGALRDIPILTVVVLGAAVTLEAAGRSEEAAVLFGAEVALMGQGLVRGPEITGARERTVAALGDEAYRRAHDRGAAMTYEEVVAEMRSVLGDDGQQ
ncbi:transcriptional regulator, winged helix family [Catenulispora acidiphila DSM 44928]|uniref:Transcriptional regulator, winged helix family n=1 Tax=Catenulispora acidiphila (strain DSM 44928 / JCM 14897 / NBRC 102108 / NRRL B-24433 / ID139908) TaxID=479433 RepID=C7QK44_CATAD|nr:BTAD domain-containing putative transcriptional regulator [Catenulispora acidiphila]ACU75118.1 transcriptional regulator, winged helix family [Catenulispora acidiphila DSM 44928]